MDSLVAAAACARTGIAPSQTLNVTSSGETAGRQPDVGAQDPHGEVRGGRRLSAPVDALEAPGGCVSRGPGADNLPLPRQQRKASGDGSLEKLVRARVRREAREVGFDWAEFRAGDREQWLTDAVQRKVAGRGSGVGGTAALVDEVAEVVRAVLEEMDANPSLRPSQAGLSAEQGRRGDLGRETQQGQAENRKWSVKELVEGGVTNNAEIGRRLGIDRTTVWRIRKELAEEARAAAEAAALVVEEAEVAPWTFPAEDVPAQVRWPAWQFMNWTGLRLDEGQVRWICDMGRCYEAEGRVDELMDAIRASAGAVVDPWSYLQRCGGQPRGRLDGAGAAFGGQSWSWAGEKRLEYSLLAIAGGQVEAAVAVSAEGAGHARSERGRGRSCSVERPRGDGAWPCRAGWRRSCR